MTSPDYVSPPSFAGTEPVQLGDLIWCVETGSRIHRVNDSLVYVREPWGQIFSLGIVASAVAEFTLTERLKSGIEAKYF